MSDNTKYSAGTSLAGYLFQCRIALLRGLELAKKNPAATISIEKFDDVSYDTDNIAQCLLQAKHHIKPKSLDDKSVDVWKTLRIWIESYNEGIFQADKTRYFLVTTASASDDSAIAMLREGARPEQRVKARMPDDQEMEYLPTQAIADYLATEGQVPLDGIIFPSVQVGGKGLNIVLFHKASRSRVVDIPRGTEIEARTYSIYADGPEPDYSVTEEVPPAQEKDEADKSDPLGFPDVIGDWNDDLNSDAREETLEIDLEAVCVHEVGAVEIRTDRHVVSRHRFEQRDWKF